jgi:hypothetical protein
MPTSALVYLGLQLDAQVHTLLLTPACIHQLLQFVANIPQATRQDLCKVAGYTVWIAWALGWPIFTTTIHYNWNTFSLPWMHKRDLPQKSNILHQPKKSRLLYSKAIPTSTAFLNTEPPRDYFAWTFND